MSITLGCCAGSNSKRNARNGKEDVMKRTHVTFRVPPLGCIAWTTRRIRMATALAIGAVGLLALDASPAKAFLMTTGPTPDGSPVGGFVCADVRANSLNERTAVQAFDCHGAPNQQFEWYGQRIYTEGAHLCLDVLKGLKKPGSIVDSFDCNTTGAQTWSYVNGQIKNTNSGLCLDAGNLKNGTQLIVNTCNPSSASQQWQLK